MYNLQIVAKFAIAVSIRQTSFELANHRQICYYGSNILVNAYPTAAATTAAATTITTTLGHDSISHPFPVTSKLYVTL